MATKSKHLKITLIKSTIAAKPVHKECVKGLGLKRMNQTVHVQNNECMRGMISKVSHLLLVEEA